MIENNTRPQIFQILEEGGEFEEMQMEDPELETLSEFYNFLLDQEEFQDVSEDDIVDKIEELASTEDGLALLNQYAKAFNKVKKQGVDVDREGIISSMKNGGRINKLINKYNNYE